MRTTPSRKKDLLCLLVLVFVHADAVSAKSSADQTAVSAPQSKIVGFLLTPLPRERQREVYAERRAVPNAFLPTDRFPGSQEGHRAESRTQRAPDRAEYTVFEPPEIYPGGQKTISETRIRPIAVLMVRNSSRKTIKSVEWEFTFPRFERGAEVVYHQAVTKIRIPPDETGSLTKLLKKDKCEIRSDVVNGTPYISRVCDGKSTGSYPLQMRIMRVKYTDGTVEEQANWKVATKPVGRPSMFEPGIPFSFCLPPD